jgi:hypothetical protein
MGLMINLKWHGEIPDNILELDHLVKQDLVGIHDDLDGECGELIFHHVFVGETHDGPLVFVWGESGDNDQYHCEYDSNPKWESINSLDNDQELS